MNDDVRTVDELLQLNTYQGMSDAEIQSLIEFYVVRETEMLRSMAATAFDNGVVSAQAKATSDYYEYAKQTLANTIGAAQLEVISYE